MSNSTDKEKLSEDSNDSKPIRERGVGNPKSHSQDADRHRKMEHQKSNKHTDQ